MRLLCYLSFSLAINNNNNNYRAADDEADKMAAAGAKRDNRSDRGFSDLCWRMTTEFRNMMPLTVLRPHRSGPLWTMVNVRLARIPVVSSLPLSR
jgi:hypothetical protein